MRRSLLISTAIIMTLTLIVVIVMTVIIPNVTSDIQIESSSKFLPNGGSPEKKVKISVDVSYDNIVVGQAFDDVGGVKDAGSITIYDGKDQQWNDGVKLVPDDVSELSDFGFAVSIDGNRVLVGAPGDVEKTRRFSPGSAYIYRLNNDGEWIQETKLTPSDQLCDDQFGYSVTLKGMYAIVGQPSNLNNTGSVYVFALRNGVWVQEAVLIPHDGGWGDSFGESVSLYGDYLAIGSSWQQSNRGLASVYVYKRFGSLWIHEARLFPEHPLKLGSFGSDIKMGRGRLLIGSSAEDSYKGAAHLYKRVNSMWTLEKRFTEPESQGGNMFSGDRYGYSVAMFGDLITIGAPLSDESRKNSGAVFVYKFFGRRWQRVRKILSWDVSSTNEFGASLSLAADKIVVSSIDVNNTRKTKSGSAYVFHFIR